MERAALSHDRSVGRDALRAALAANENSPVRRTLLRACKQLASQCRVPGCRQSKSRQGRLKSFVFWGRGKKKAIRPMAFFILIELPSGLWSSSLSYGLYRL
jgi:hypothetical protein